VTVRDDQKRPAATSHRCHVAGTIAPCAVFQYGSNTNVVNPPVASPLTSTWSWKDGSATGTCPVAWYVQ
jgi:hypothetical protein